MQLRRSVSIAALAWLVATSAFAQASYPDFTSTAGLTLNGATAAVNNGIDAAPVLRVARTLYFDGGSAFTTDTICVTAFSTFFQFRITNAGGGFPDATGQDGADGMTLTFQNAAPTAMGLLGGGLAYQNITPSVAVEIDTWDNGSGDAGTNHVGINVNGNIASVAKTSVAGRFDDGALWSVWVDYDGSVLQVRVSNTGLRPEAPTVAFPIDLAAVLGSSTAHAGFTAATGAAFGNHDIVSWSHQCGNLTIAACDTGIEDIMLAGGGLLSDRIDACAIAANTHGQFVSCVAALTNTAQKSGVITGKQKGAIQSCAARAPYYTGAVATAEMIGNGDFETGDTSGWSLTTTGSGVWSINDGSLNPNGPALPLPPIEGAFDLVSHQGGPQLNRAMQVVAVPLDVREATLTWSDRIRSYAALADPGQEYRVVIRALDLSIIAEVFSTNAGNPPLQEGPNARSVDLTTALQGLKGQTVLLSFEQQAQSSFFTLTIDDVSLMVKSR